MKTYFKPDAMLFESCFAKYQALLQDTSTDSSLSRSTVKSRNLSSTSMSNTPTTISSAVKGYVASDSTNVKVALHETNPSMVFPEELQIFHVDKSAVDDSDRAFQGTLDVYAELVVLIDAMCLIMAWSKFSYIAHYIGLAPRCGIYVKDCDFDDQNGNAMTSQKRVTLEHHEYRYELGRFYLSS